MRDGVRLQPQRPHDPATVGHRDRVRPVLNDRYRRRRMRSNLLPVVRRSVMRTLVAIAVAVLIAFGMFV